MGRFRFIGNTGVDFRPAIFIAGFFSFFDWDNLISRADQKGES